jgi:purine nucleosidase
MPASTPIIIDTDPGVDDALALLVAAASPELEVLGITTVGGNVGLDQATDNARRIVTIAWQGRTSPPIYRGAGDERESAEHVHGQDGLGGITAARDCAGQELFPLGPPVQSEAAHRAIGRLARSRPGAVTLVALGPLTNLAAALREDPEGTSHLREVVIMGGAFQVPGNAGPVTEFNVVADPVAAQVVCESGLPLRWIPLDVTHHCLLRASHLDQLPDTARGRLARAMLGRYVDYHHLGYGELACFLHDPAAIAAVVWPELFDTESLRVDVETLGTLTRGMTVADFRPEAYRSAAPANSRVSLSVRHEALVAYVAERLG